MSDTTGTTDNFLRRTTTGTYRGELPIITPVTVGDESRNIDHTITGAALVIAWMETARQTRNSPASYESTVLPALDELNDEEFLEVVADLGAARETINHIEALLAGHLRLKRPALVAKMVSETVTHMVTEALRETANASAAADAADRTRPTNPDLN